MKKMFFNKILIIFTLFLCVLTLFVCPVFGADSSVLPDGVYHELILHGNASDFDSADYYILFTCPDSTDCQLFFGPSEFLARKVSDTSWEFKSASGAGMNRVFHDMGYGNGIEITGGIGVDSWNTIDISNYSIVESNFVIRDFETGEVFSTPSSNGDSSTDNGENPDGGGTEGGSGDTSGGSIDFGWFDWLKEGFSVLVDGIASVIDFLNPASENFFVYKLIELLGDLLKFLFVPSEERVTALFDMVSSKFSFVDDIKFAVLSLQDLILNANGAPRLTINLGSTKYTEATSIVIDFSWYEPFKAYGDLVITGFVYANFLWRLFIKSPGIVSGTSGSVVDFYEIREKNGGKG